MRATFPNGAGMDFFPWQTSDVDSQAAPTAVAPAPTPAPAAPIAAPAPSTPRGASKASVGSYRNIPHATEDDYAALQAAQQAAAQPPPAPFNPADSSLHDLYGQSHSAARQRQQQLPSAQVIDPPAAPSALPAPSKAASTPPVQAVMLPTDEADEEPELTAPSSQAPTTANPVSAPAASGQPTMHRATRGVVESVSPATGLDDGSSDDEAEQARQQAIRNQNATNRSARSQGAQMETTPTGEVHQAVDNAGNPLFKGAVLERARQLDDGRFYRVSRDQYGNQHYFDLSQGVAGSDYHVDPGTGEMYVEGDGADGGSKRTVIGTDGYTVFHNGLKERQAGFQADRAAAQMEIDQLEHGTDGAASLEYLRREASQRAQAVAPAQRFMGEVQAYLQANPSAVLTSEQVGQYEAAEAMVGQHTPALDQIQGQIEQRQGLVAAARQRHDQASASAGEAYQMASLAGQRRVRQETTDDLASYAQGNDLPPAKLARLQRFGLIDQDGQLADVAAGLLPQERTARPPQAAQDDQPDQPRPGEDLPSYWQRQQAAIVNEYPEMAQPGSAASLRFKDAFARVGNDPSKALAVARAVLGK